jgi:hypothetical protein
MEGFDFVPNPAVSEFRIKGDFSSIDFPIYVRISDLTGKVVNAQTISSRDQYISIRDLVSGVYIVSLSDDERYIGSRRLVVTR